MTWAGVLSTVSTHLTTAGATLSSPDTGTAVTNIQAGEPSGVTQPSLHYWYDGDRESTTGGNTLTKVNMEELVRIGIFVPVGLNRSPAKDAVVETFMRNAKFAILDALWGDVQLGGNCIGIEIPPVESGWTVVGDTLCRTVQILLWVDLAEVHTIAT
jgi:hypothetical protein